MRKKRQDAAQIMSSFFLSIVTVLLVSGQAATAQGETSPNKSGQSTGIPVTAGLATIRTVPIFVTGIGTVQAYNAVSVKSRVDGQIMKVFFKEGDEVKAGSPLFQIDPRPYQAILDQAQGNKRKDAGQLEGAKLNLKRYSKLLSTGFQTQQSYDDQQASVQQLEGAVAADDAAIESASLNLAYALIRSPIAGRTGARLVDPGNFVQAAAGTNLVSITQLKPIYVSFTVPQENLDTIINGQKLAPLDVVSYAANNRTILAAGKLTLIDNQVDTATGTIHLKASFPNGDERLWPGAFANVRLILGQRPNAITVPVEAIMQGSSGDYAFVVKNDDTVERRDLQIAARQDGIAVITSGIAPGERVVMDGQYRLSPGAKVRVELSKVPPLSAS